MNKYRVFYKDDFGSETPVFSESDEYGDWRKADEVDAALAEKDAEIAALKADAARLDKLPQCFHMLRFRDCQWHFTFDTNRQHYSLRDAIDAYEHPAVPGIDQGQFLAACEAGNQVFGERNSGGTPE